MDWKEEYKRRLVSAEEAARMVKSGERVVIPIGQSADVIPRALAARRDELRNVEILHGAPNVMYDWFQPGWEESFLVNLAQYTGAIPRGMMLERRGDFTPVTFALEFKELDERRPGMIEPDVLITVVSPPDEHGFCSFGHCMWQKKEYVKRAKKVLAEQNSYLIRTYGDNFVHVSELDCIVEADPIIPSAEEMEAVIGQTPPQNQEKLRWIVQQQTPDRLSSIKDALLFFPPDELAVLLGLGEATEGHYAIAGYLSELIKDGDTVQIGYGTTSNPLVTAGLFDNKHDLGLHTEVCPGGLFDLVKEGVFTGKYKTLHQGKAVATSFWPAARPPDLEYIDGNPLFELYGSNYTNNIKTIAAHDNMVAINNAMFVDLTGQIGSETTMGFRLQNGPGGQLDFTIGALYSRGGRSITVLPSRALRGAVSRIVPLIEEGIMVTVPRTYADFIVTDQGIASLLGKSQRRRAEELIAIAHPDFRAELRKEAQKFFYPE